MRSNLAIIGGGPTGLRAAEVAAENGASVTLYDAMPSVGRKFLVAGKSGLNLTNTASLEAFAASYSAPSLDWWRTHLTDFSNNDLRDWAKGLGEETISTKGGKIFPASMKAAPLLRRWLLRLRSQGVSFKMHHRWTGIKTGSPHLLHFDYKDTPITASHDAVIFALGGASWPQTGSDGSWVSYFERDLDITSTPLSPANCGWEVAWPPGFLSSHEGTPLKNLIVHAEDQSRTGELVITHYGLEGAPIYRLGPTLRSMQRPEIKIDLKPDFNVSRLVRKMDGVKRNHLAQTQFRWKLPPAIIALLSSLHQANTFSDTERLATLVKACPIPLLCPRPIEEAISSAGGVPWEQLNPDLTLKKYPSIAIGGEMIDWEAPTGGFLLQACFLTGALAAQSLTS